MPSTDPLLPEQIVHEMSESIRVLETAWSDDQAVHAKRWLVDAFALMPRDKRVISAHIRFNSIAAKNGGERHSPTAHSADHA